MTFRELKLDLDYMSGPIVKDVYDKEEDKLITGIEVIDNSSKIQTINEDIQNFYSSLYDYDEDDNFTLDDKKLRAETESLKSKLTELIGAIDGVNDGSFSINNQCSLSLRNS